MRPQKRGRSNSPVPATTPPPAGRKKRTRGTGSNGGTHGNRARHGAALSESGGAAGPARLARLRERSHLNGQVIQATYSIEKEGSATTTGWQGSPPPPLAQELISELYDSGEIKSLLASFYPIGYPR